MQRIHLAALLGVVLLMGACIGFKAQSTSREPPDRITTEQVQDAAGALNAYVLVQRLRPNWLRKRGRHSITNEGSILVYVDGMRYGAGHDHGVILVYTKSGK